MNKFDECNTPFTYCWCNAVPGRMNNPKCQGLIPTVSIDSPIFMWIILGSALILAAYKFNLIPFLNKKENWESKIN